MTLGAVALGRDRLDRVRVGSLAFAGLVLILFRRPCAVAPVVLGAALARLVQTLGKHPAAPTTA